MVDWQSSEELARDAMSFNNFIHALLGLYIWEWATSLDYDVSYVLGKRRFRWPMIFYFLGRYCLLLALIGIAIALNTTTKIDCQALYTFNQLLGSAAIGFASINLSLRTIALWERSWYIVVPLVAVILGHWSLLLHGVLLKADFVEGQGCVITQTSNKILAAGFVYSMVFDFCVLILSGIRLVMPGNVQRTQLIKILFQDGLIYFAVAFAANLIATVFMLLNLNAVMSIIANVPAAIIETIAACRAVRRLTMYAETRAERDFPAISDVRFARPFRTGNTSGLGMSDGRVPFEKDARTRQSIRLTMPETHSGPTESLPTTLTVDSRMMSTISEGHPEDDLGTGIKFCEPDESDSRSNLERVEYKYPPPSPSM